MIWALPGHMADSWSQISRHEFTRLSHRASRCLVAYTYWIWMDVRFDMVWSRFPRKTDSKILGRESFLHDCKWHMVRFETWFWVSSKIMPRMLWLSVLAEGQAVATTVRLIRMKSRLCSSKMPSCRSKRANEQTIHSVMYVRTPTNMHKNHQTERFIFIQCRSYTPPQLSFCEDPSSGWMLLFHGVINNRFLTCKQTSMYANIVCKCTATHVHGILADIVNESNVEALLHRSCPFQAAVCCSLPYAAIRKFNHLVENNGMKSIKWVTQWRQVKPNSASWSLSMQRCDALDGWKQWQHLKDHSNIKRCHVKSHPVTSF